ncbi:MAG: HlyD family efflux transporter periplasmic adaptor subunit [Bacteroidetes bacterium]|nr:HlyD family efflux transporter periplasmic adaptor subunit [Bacteroidota bacterium]
MPSEEKEIIIRTEEVNEILTSTPKWILRWGISVVFILIIVGISLSYFIKYPDVLNTDITITTLNPPVNLLSKNTGKLSHLLVKDKQLVSAGQTIGIIENTANYKDVLILLALANSLQEQLKRNDTLLSTNINDSLKTGELTPYYLQFVKSLKDFNLYKNINSYSKQIILLKSDLINYTSLLGKYRNQQKINNEQLTLAENDYNRDKKLFEEKVISAREFETQKKNYLSAKNSNEQTKITCDNALIQINTIEKNILQLQIQNYQEQAKVKNELQQQLKNVVSEINKWKLLYVIESPVAGKVSFFNVWAINQNIKQGDELFSIIPIQKQVFVGKCMVPMINSGKLQIAQKVNIKLDNYPFNENGMLNGIVANISEVPNKDGYAIDVALPTGLITSYSKTLVYKEQMKGKASIITKNISVMDRLFFNFRKLLHKK